MSEILKAGTEVGIRKLTNMYDRYVLRVLSGFFEQLDTPRGKPRKFRVRKDTPTEAEYAKLKSERYATTVQNMVDEAYGEAESLGEEMREWHDGMPENLQEGDVGSRVSEAADSLEYVDREDYPECLPEIATVFYPSLDCSSRSDRACEAAAQLRQAAEDVREWLEDDDQKTLPEEDRTTAGEYANTIDGHADELEAVEFPSMYG